MASEALIESVREHFGRLVYTHKVHEKQREQLSTLANWSRWSNIVINAVSVTGIATAIASSRPSFIYVSLGLAVVAAAYAFVQLSFDPLRDADLHRSAAKSLLKYRDGYERLMADILDGAVNDKNARRRRDKLGANVQRIYSHAPDTSARAYRAAQVALQLHEDMTFSDEELNRLLPAALQWPRPGA